MNKEIDILDIISELEKHNKFGIEYVLKAYKLAEEKHKGVMLDPMNFVGTDAPTKFRNALNDYLLRIDPLLCGTVWLKRSAAWHLRLSDGDDHACL